MIRVLLALAAFCFCAWPVVGYSYGFLPGLTSFMAGVFFCIVAGIGDSVK